MRLHSNLAGAIRRSIQRIAVCSFVLGVLAGCESDRRKTVVIPEPAATFNRVLDQRGMLTYVVQSYSSPGVLEVSSQAGALVIMRRPDDMRPVGGAYYDDGYGNLVRFDAFKAPAYGGVAGYALTFRKNGDLQLAVDFRNDLVVDVLVELGPDGRLGFLADPDLQWFLDCLSDQIGGGANLVEAANACLAIAAGGAGGGGGGGLGSHVGSEIDRLKEPDCEEQEGVPGKVTQGGHQSSVTIISEQGYKVTATTTENEDGSSSYEIRMYDPEGQLVYQERGRRDTEGNLVHQHIRTFDRPSGESEFVVVRDRVYENGELVEDFETSAPNWQDIRWEGVEIEYLGPRRRPGPTRQPGPECDECPVEDPRCAPAPNDIASFWDCVAETRKSPLECLQRLQDLIYTATGGRCSAEPGPDDRPSIRCSDRRLQDCIAEGRIIADCLRENPGYGGGDDMSGPEDDYLRDRLGGSKGVAGAYLDTTPAGAVFIAFCPDGAEQFCRGGGF
jgi:hypothetical protein